MDKNNPGNREPMTKASVPLPPGAKCTRCRQQAHIRLPQHHALFCPDCFVHFFHSAVVRAMKKFAVDSTAPILVAVSGGKDSLALWDVLHSLGYPTRGLHLSLGIEGFSEASAEAISAFARERNLPWVRYSLEDAFGYSVDEIRRRTRRKICSVCGLLKRQILNRFASREGSKVLATGHNLDDEAGRLLGNLMRHRTQYFEKQYPYLPSPHPMIPAKMKPLYRLDAVEILTYCSIRSIEPVGTKCPYSRGATSHNFKEALDFLESRMPGTKRDFLFSYVNGRQSPSADADFGTCRQCLQPTYADLCSVCSLANQLRDTAEQAESE